MKLDTTRPAGSDRALALADVASAQARACIVAVEALRHSHAHARHHALAHSDHHHEK
ncbi:hypothetical protein [Pseudolysobacter antarcticus]|uniref:hypothetical protein n=1 Tax=Pseudolysobacter antarcticus TaxID=2511995 RepID=UPI0013EA0690|nr:hypothetical protein [Pseudolysobacter antarcticus]